MWVKRLLLTVPRCAVLIVAPEGGLFCKASPESCLLSLLEETQKSERQLASLQLAYHSAVALVFLLRLWYLP